MKSTSGAVSVSTTTFSPPRVEIPAQRGAGDPRRMVRWGLRPSRQSSSAAAASSAASAAEDRCWGWWSSPQRGRGPRLLVNARSPESEN